MEILCDPHPKVDPPFGHIIPKKFGHRGESQTCEFATPAFSPAWKPTPSISRIEAFHRVIWERPALLGFRASGWDVLTVPTLYQRGWRTPTKSNQANPSMGVKGFPSGTDLNGIKQKIQNSVF